MSPNKTFICSSWFSLFIEIFFNNFIALSNSSLFISALIFLILSSKFDEKATFWLKVKIRKKLNWRPNKNFKTGLEETFDWYAENFKFFRTFSKQKFFRRIGLNL